MRQRKAAPGERMNRGLAAAIAVVTAASVALTGCAQNPRLDAVIAGHALVRNPADNPSARVGVTRAGRSVELGPHADLRSGDLITTGADTSLLIRYPDGNEVFVAPETRIELGSIRVFFGNLLMKVRGAFEVRTEFVSASSEGTIYTVGVDRNGSAVCNVLEGTVRIASRAGGFEPLSSGAATQVTWMRDLKPASRPLGAGELEQTRQWVQEIERLAPAPPVNPAWMLPAIPLIIWMSNRDRDRTPDRTQPPRTDPPSTPAPDKRRAPYTQ